MREYVNARAFHQDQATYLDQVERGNRLVLTRRGVPVAVVLPFDERLLLAADEWAGR